MTTLQFTPRRGEAGRFSPVRLLRCRSPGSVGATIAVAIAAVFVMSNQKTLAQVASTMNGPPNQVIPYAPEPGVPAYNVPIGTPTPTPAPTAGTGAGDGSGDGSGDGTGSGGSSNSALGTMLDQSWGSQAVTVAQSLGVNASALAATCVLESGCTDGTANGSAKGLFQMQPAAFQEGLDTALAADPSLASQIVAGPNGANDPVTAAIAASGYLTKGANYLEAHGVENPTVLDVRGYFNFGSVGGEHLALAQDSDPVAGQLSMYTAQQLQANGIVPGETVGQWKASVAAKIGSAAGQPVFT